jgi:magnesium-transporting ATPase (P-type)
MAQGKFVRVVSQPQLLALAFGAMVGWSWVALSGTWIAGAGSLGAMFAFLVGGTALVLSLCICTLYLPWSPSALLWPAEWAIVFSWCAIGVVLLALSGRRVARHRA